MNACPNLEITMNQEIIIYGKDKCPFTSAARTALSGSGRKVRYINVLENKNDLDTMLKYTNGERRIPVIVDGETISVGFKGKS